KTLAIAIDIKLVFDFIDIPAATVASADTVDPHRITGQQHMAVNHPVQLAGRLDLERFGVGLRLRPLLGLSRAAHPFAAQAPGKLFSAGTGVGTAYGGGA